MSVIIPPSSRPLLLWLAASAVCAALLALEGAALLTLWRRPTRLWRLGLAALAGAALGGVLTGRTLAAYHDLVNISACYDQGCEQLFPWVTHAVVAAVILGSMLIIFTVASVLAALVWSALDGAQRQAPTETTLGLLWRFAQILGFALAAGVGFYWMTEGAYLWIGWAFFTNPSSFGDGLGYIPLYLSAFEAIGGVVVLGMGVCLLWLLLRRDAPQAVAAQAVGG